jgi:hypothetical protein
MWNLFRTHWHMYGFLFLYFGSSLLVSFHQYSILVFTCMLLSLEWHKNGTVWLLTKQFSFGNRGALVCKLHPNFSSSAKAVLYLLLSSAEFSLLRAGFEPQQVHVVFVVDKVALGQTFLRVLRFSSVTMLFHKYSTLNPPSRLPMRVGNWKNLTTFQKLCYPRCCWASRKESRSSICRLLVVRICCLTWRKYISFCFPVLLDLTLDTFILGLD